jgi:hypothetical protein
LAIAQRRVELRLIDHFDCFEVFELRGERALS